MTTLLTSVDYEIDGSVFEASVAANGNHSSKKPAVLIAHAWAGRTDYEVHFAKKVAELGYIGIAIDLYGKGITGTTTEECQGLMTPFVENRAKLQRQLAKNLEFIKTLPNVDPQQIAAMGFCFGGLCVLDMARAGLDVRGAASLHGLLGAPGNTGGNTISAKVIALHGYDDPMAPPDDVTTFGEEMTNAKADWQLHAYGGVMHAFTNPKANDPSFGTVFDQTANDRAWTSVINFLSEIFV